MRYDGHGRSLNGLVPGIREHAPCHRHIIWGGEDARGGDQC